MHVPVNRTFQLKRGGVVTYDQLAGLLQPPSTRSYQILTLVSDVPATKLLEIFFADLYDVQEQDQLVDDADSTKTYRVRFVEEYDMPRLQYTWALVEAMWGTN